MHSSETMWLAVGFVGQAMFALRFVLQWIATERAQRSVIPVGFWYLSIAGAVIVLVYAVWRRDPVFIVGQSTGLLIYLRNLHFVRRGVAGE